MEATLYTTHEVLDSRSTAQYLKLLKEFKLEEITDKDIEIHGTHQNSYSRLLLRKEPKLISSSELSEPRYSQACGVHDLSRILLSARSHLVPYAGISYHYHTGKFKDKQVPPSMHTRRTIRVPFYAYSPFIELGEVAEWIDNLCKGLAYKIRENVGVGVDAIQIPVHERNLELQLVLGKALGYRCVAYPKEYMRFEKNLS